VVELIVNLGGPQQVVDPDDARRFTRYRASWVAGSQRSFIVIGWRRRLVDVQGYMSWRTCSFGQSSRGASIRRSTRRWRRRPAGALAVIDGGYHLVTLTTMGVVLGALGS